VEAAQRFRYSRGIAYQAGGLAFIHELFCNGYLNIFFQKNWGLAKTMSSGAKSLYTYDSGGWLSSLMQTDAVGATVVNQSYTRDRVGNITATNVTAGPSPALPNTRSTRYIV
jgi:hypothetical protein